MKKRILIEGMSCMHCVKHVTSALKEVAGVSTVQVNLGTKQALVEVSPQVSDQALMKAIDEAGYEAKKVETI